jgi:8-oxo-dGTP pyrophosphatase MutT (NUDIX family)
MGKLKISPAGADKILYDNKWLQLKEIDGYVYSHEIRCNGIIVMVLPYRRTGSNFEFLVRAEITPCWSKKPTLSAMTGGAESPEGPAEDVVRELYEEAGYRVKADQLKFLGMVRASKSADTYYHLFTIDVTGMTPDQATGDGSKNDLAPSVWLTEEQIVGLEDAQALAAYVKIKALLK